MQITPVGIISAVVMGSAASVAGGYLAGVTLGGKDLGRGLAGFLGTLYGPLAGATGVMLGLCVLALADRS